MECRLMVGIAALVLESQVQIPAGLLSQIEIENWVFTNNTSVCYFIKYCNTVMGGRALL